MKILGWLCLSLLNQGSCFKSFLSQLSKISQRGRGASVNRHPEPQILTGDSIAGVLFSVAAKNAAMRVIPYQFTKVLHMTPPELNEILYVGSLGGHMYPKGILLKLLVWLPRNALLNILLFCYLSVPITIQSIIT